MLAHIEAVLSADQVALCRERLAASEWVDGRVTAGQQSAEVKRNLQIPEGAPVARELGDLILGVLGRNPHFVSAALPRRVFPPLFNRYDAGMDFGAHVDNAIRFSNGVRFRTDVSCTLFLSEPEEYDGGELIIEDVYGEHAVKLAAGDMILYPATSLHRVAPITRGSRWAAFFWTQSMVREDSDRALLYRMDKSITLAREVLGDKHPAVLGLTSTFHNLLRKWADL